MLLVGECECRTSVHPFMLVKDLKVGATDTEEQLLRKDLRVDWWRTSESDSMFYHMDTRRCNEYGRTEISEMKVCVCVCVLGALDFLEKPTVAFIRLKESQLLKAPSQEPVPAPIRFIFILVGPSSDVDYHECGRAMRALLEDGVSKVQS